MRFLPALAVALLPVAAAAQADEWVRDDMSDESLWLLRTGNLAREAPRAGTLPGAPDGGSQWVMSKGDGPAYVVYFIPGRIHEVEIDTHRLAGASGDFTLAVSTDGKLYQPLDTGAVLLDTSFGWDYRLMASDQIPESATHLLVKFPEGSTAHSLSEVWIRYTWDDALVSRFLPSPVVAPPVHSELSQQSEAELQMLLEQLMAQPTPRSEPQMELTQAAAPSPPVTTPAPTPPPVSYTAPPVTPEPAPVVQSATAEFIEEAPPAIVAEISAPLASNEKESLEEPIELAAALLAVESPEATAAETAPAAGATVELPAAAEPAVEVPLVEPSLAPEPETAPVPTEEPEEIASSPMDTVPIDVAVFDTPPESSPGLAAPAIEIQSPAQLETPGEATLEVPTVAAEVVENSPPAEPGAEDPEKVWVLPTFTLPAMVSSKESETIAPAQMEPAPRAEESAVAEMGARPIDALEAAPPSSGVIEFERPTTDSPNTESIAAEELPAAPVQDSSPIVVAASVERPSEVPPAELSEDNEPRQRPALKMKRTGPRSKSRGSYVARG